MDILDDTVNCTAKLFWIVRNVWFHNKLSLNLQQQPWQRLCYFGEMPVRSDFVLVALLSVILGILSTESGENISERAECLRVCVQARQEGSNTGFKESRFPSCHQCLRRRKGRHSLTFKQLQRRSLFQISNCVGETNDPLAPNIIISPSKESVTFGQYENTSYWYVNASWPPLEDSSGKLYATMLRLSMEVNDFNSYCTVLPKNQTFVNINISRYGYTCPSTIWLQVLSLPYRNGEKLMGKYKPRFCPPTSSTTIKTTGQPTSSTVIKTTGQQTSSKVIKTTGLKSFSTTTTQTFTPLLASKSNLTSTKSSLNRGATPTLNTKSSTATTPTSINIGTKDPNHTIKYVSIASVSGIILGLALVLFFLRCVLVYTRRRRGGYPVPSGFDYHAFIIYNKEDSYWVKNKLLHLLEDKHNLKCCIHYRDFEPGNPFYDSMAESVQKSYKIIAVYSQNFLNSHYCIHELDLAKYRLLNQRDNSLVIIRIDGTDCKQLPPELRERTLIDYHTALERPLWINRLLRFLDVPEDSRNNQRATLRQDRDNNNCNDSRTTGRRVRNTFGRLNSTSSTDTAVSCV